MEFYSTVRLRLMRDYGNEVKKELVVKTILGEAEEEPDDDDRPETKAATAKKKKGEKGKVEKILGIRTNIAVTKNSIDDPYRTAYIYIMFGYGIDDVRANLQWMKDMLQTSTYVTPGGRKFVGIAQAIKSVEDHNEEAALREQVIDLWETIENAMKTKRKAKVRI